VTSYRAVLTVILCLFVGSAIAQRCEGSSFSDGFDFPVGRPDGVGYRVDTDHNELVQLKRGPARHAGEDWNGNGGGNTDWRDPVYAVSNGRIVYAENRGRTWGNVIILEQLVPWRFKASSEFGFRLRRLFPVYRPPSSVKVAILS
jgi:hypothetical protein